jgi:hypothetical protein
MMNLLFKRLVGPALFFSLVACHAQAGSIPLSPSPTFQMSAVTSSPPSVETPPPASVTPTPETQPVPPQPTPEHIIGGGTVQDGPFTFFLWLFRDPTMNRQPTITSLYSDLNGVGVYQSWVYRGPDLNAAVQVYGGTLPQLDLIMEYPSLTSGQGDGRMGGVVLPGGFVMPGKSHAGDQVQIAMKVVTPQGEYGAVLAFVLQQGPSGFEPADISVSILAP